MQGIEYYSYKIRKEKSDAKLKEYLRKVVCVLGNKDKGLSFSQTAKKCGIAHTETAQRIYTANISDKEFIKLSRKS
jgi:hypothetical protein